MKPKANQLGTFLRSRREHLDPAHLGFVGGRRRTPGLRREELAQLAGVSATWYTWLEQGRGGAPSAGTLDRLATALRLTEIEREHLFLIGLGHPPVTRKRTAGGISATLQRVLDGIDAMPAFVKTASWDVVAWNKSADAVFGYANLEPKQRNVLRRLFGDPAMRRDSKQWREMVGLAVAVFRTEAARAPDTPEVIELVTELSDASPVFRELWGAAEVRHQGEGVKRLIHPEVGPISLEYTSFAVDGRADLGLVVFVPSTTKDFQAIRSAMKLRRKKSKAVVG